VAVIGYLCWGEYTRKARVEGVLLPDLGVIRIPPPRWHGTGAPRPRRQSVRRGDVLFVLSVDRTTSSGDSQASVAAQPGRQGAQPARRDAASR
jgi:membrane fusion protein